jgi:hypothetical protein
VLFVQSSHLASQVSHQELRSQTGKHESWGAKWVPKTLVCGAEFECGGQRGQQIQRDLEIESKIQISSHTHPTVGFETAANNVTMESGDLGGTLMPKCFARLGCGLAS